MTILYVAGYGRSGSTTLGDVWATERGVQHLGEVARIADSDFGAAVVVPVGRRRRAASGMACSNRCPPRMPLTSATGSRSSGVARHGRPSLPARALGASHPGGICVSEQEFGPTCERDARTSGRNVRGLVQDGLGAGQSPSCPGSSWDRGGGAHRMASVQGGPAITSERRVAARFAPRQGGSREVGGVPRPCPHRGGSSRGPWAGGRRAGAWTTLSRCEMRRANSRRNTPSPATGDAYPGEKTHDHGCSPAP